MAKFDGKQKWLVVSVLIKSSSLFKQENVKGGEPISVTPNAPGESIVLYKTEGIVVNVKGKVTNISLSKCAVSRSH
jgi:hypothetical protein